MWGDQRHEEEPHHHGQHDDPHQRVAEVSPRDTHLDDIAGAQPGEHDDDTGAERAEVLLKNLWYNGWHSYLVRGQIGGSVRVPD